MELACRRMCMRMLCVVSPPHARAPHPQIQGYIVGDTYYIVRPTMVVSVLDMKTSFSFHYSLNNTL